MSNTGSSENKLGGVQVLRGVAALLVLWCHLKFNLGREAESFSGIPVLATNWGAIGVDIFFVISGFVISMTAAKLGNNWRAFLASRVARIVPLYFAISTYSLVEAVISSHVSGKPLRISGLSVFDTYAFIPLFDTQYLRAPILGNGWTLSLRCGFTCALPAC